MIVWIPASDPDAARRIAAACDAGLIRPLAHWRDRETCQAEIDKIMAQHQRYRPHQLEIKDPPHAPCR